MNFVLALLVAALVIGAFSTWRRLKRRVVSGPYRQMNLPAESQGAFIVCAFSMLGKLAEADGEISKEEIGVVENYVDTRLNLDRRHRKLALRVFREASSSPLELRDYAEKFHRTYPDQVQLSDKMIEILVEVSAADGVLAPREDALIRSAALLLGLTGAGYERIRSKAGAGAASVH